MREIKFRAWDGELHYTGEAYPSYPQKTFFIGMDGNRYVVDNHICVKENEIIIMQYTGFKDKKGKEIYEGDILHTHKGNFVVTWDKYMFVLPSYYCGSNDVPYDYFSEQSEDEVIGNIYENPELKEDIPHD